MESSKKSPGKIGENPTTEFFPVRDHGHNTEAGENPHVNANSATPDGVKARTGDNVPTVFNAGTHMVGYLPGVLDCNKGPEHVHLTMTGNNARTGVGVTTSFGAITGNNAATGVGSAAIKNTFVHLSVAGNFRWATK